MPFVPLPAYFTDDNIVDIRTYLGYPGTYFYANPRLESAITVIGNDQVYAGKVVAILTTLNTIYQDAFLDLADEIGIAKVDSGSVGNGGVEYFPKQERSIGLRNLGRMYCARLSGIFGVELQTDVFGTRGYLGDQWKANNGNSNGFGFTLGFKS